MRAVFLALTLIAAALLSASPASAAKRRPQCASAGKTVAANSQARIYRRRGDEPTRQGGVSYWGCMYRHPLSHRWLGTDLGDEGGPGGFVLAGHLVASVDAELGSHSHLIELSVISLLTGRVTGVASYSDPDNPAFIGGFVLRPNGSIAWMKETFIAPYGPRDYFVELHKQESGRESVLASGSDIDPDSLATKGTRIFWIQAGQPQAATLH